MTRTFETVLFDLDGTLVDSAPGVLGSLHAAFAEVGLDHERAAIDRRLLGPPFHTSLPPIIGDPAAVEAVIAAYRRHYGATGLAQSVPFPGIDALLTGLRAAGVRVAVATSKGEPFAERIVARLGWADRFDAVVGDTLTAARPTKADVVAEALCRLGSPDPADVVMIGDRHHDVDGARAHGVDCWGVDWGYADPGELVRAGAAPVFATVADLRAALLVNAPATPGASSARG